VGVYFVTQSPADIPDSVLGQLGNRVQHALRAFTPSDQKAVRIAANTLRANPAFDAAGVITELGVGEALVSCSTRRTAQHGGARLHRPPASRIGPLSDGRAPGAYSGLIALRQIRHPEDRESAFERLQEASPAADDETASHRPPGRRSAGCLQWHPVRPTGPRGGQHDGVVQTAAKSVARTIGNEVGRQLMRGVLGPRWGAASGAADAGK
jgi:hypothetical protein